MTNALKGMLVLKDEAGAYYILPQELLEQGRVRAEHTAEVEQVFASAEADDVTGYLSLNFTKITFERGFIGTLINGTPTGAMFPYPADPATNGGIGSDAAAQFRGRLK
jgi:hypothetical protein